MNPRLCLYAVAAVAAMSSVHGQQPVGSIPLDPPAPALVVDGIEVLPVQGQVYMLVGGGANVTAQVGDEGVLLVDAGSAAQSRKIVAALQRLAPHPVRFLIDTNADADHVGGNGAVVAASSGIRGPRPAQVGGANPQGQNVGIMTIAHENAYNRMLTGGPGFPGLTGEALPESTFFTPKKEFFSNHEPVQVLSQPAAHTDGDVMVMFRKSDVVSAGDVFVTTSYPVIDVARGGSIDGEIDALNTLIDLTIPERNQMGGTRVVPGHGRICNEADVVDYRDMVTIIRDRVQELSKKGMTLQQIKAARPSLEYDGIYGATSGAWTTDMFLDAVYRGVTAKGVTR
jgi:glyoxylase-like metal-dependent hydrolase (beta-lactamase superfamily II)